MTFMGTEEPDYRDRYAFHRVFEVMRRTVREKGIANAAMTRPDLVREASDSDAKEIDTQIAIAILLINEILIEKDGLIRFGPSKETYGSPGDEGNLRMGSFPLIRKEIRAKAYPIVKELIAERDGPMKSELSNPQEDLGDEWLSASEALDLTGQRYGQGTRTICKRAHAGLIRSRAKRFMSDSQTVDDFEIPANFWWAEGEASLGQNWTTGDFDTWLERKIHLKAFGVEFRRIDIEKILPAKVLTRESKRVSIGNKVFIGHGRSLTWYQLKEFLRDQLHLAVEEFNSVSTAGTSITSRLNQMLDSTTFAFLIMTAEDETPDGKQQARINVIHEVGLFQGRLGFEKAIILLEEGCEQFSNIHGLVHIPFPKGNIEAVFERVRQVLAREKVTSAQ